MVLSSCAMFRSKNKSPSGSLWTTGKQLQKFCVSTSCPCRRYHNLSLERGLWVTSWDLSPQMVTRLHLVHHLQRGTVSVSLSSWNTTNINSLSRRSGSLAGTRVQLVNGGITTMEAIIAWVSGAQMSRLARLLPTFHLLYRTRNRGLSLFQVP
jgi:hypothetical protein